MIEVDALALLQRLAIPFKRKGRALVAPCPLPGHREKEPSWSMRHEPGEEKNGFHYCFGCKRGGTPADLVAAILGFDVPTARAWLRSGAVLREQDLPARIVISVRRSKPPFQLPDGVLFGPLDEWPTAARQYLQKRRITTAQAARWGLGYAVDGRLAMRIVAPVRDSEGVVRSFVARAFVSRIAGREAKRYLEPRDEDGADHSAILGEHLWPSVSSGLRRCLAVGEGYFDGAAMERAADLPVGILHGSPSPAQGGWDSIAGKLATWPLLLVAVDPNDAGERLLSTLRSALGRYSRVVPLRIQGIDASACAERYGDEALASAMLRALDASPGTADRSAVPLPGLH